MPGEPSSTNHQHAGPNDATYSTGSPIRRAAIHGQTALFRSSLIPAFYPQGGGGGNGGSLLAET